MLYFQVLNFLHEYSLSVFVFVYFIDKQLRLCYFALADQVLRCFVIVELVNQKKLQVDDQNWESKHNRPKIFGLKEVSENVGQ